MCTYEITDATAAHQYARERYQRTITNELYRYAIPHHLQPKKKKQDHIHGTYHVYTRERDRGG